MERATLVVLFAATLAGCGTSVSGDGGDPIDCAAHVRCSGPQLGDGVRACPSGVECSYVPGCVTAICIETEEACVATCGDASCSIQESFPSRIGCEGEVTRAVDDVTCDEVTAEIATIRSCTSADQCGLVLEGTSCGCTRDLVARLDAPIAILEALRAAAPDCGFSSTCDCPEADGFACVDGLCTWNYLDGP